jgi:hypothetical protein
MRSAVQMTNHIQAVRVRAWIATLTPISRPSPTAAGRGGGVIGSRSTNPR